MNARWLGRLLVVAITGVLVIALSGVVVAQEPPADPASPSEVDGDEIVTLEGVVVEHIEDNEYLFDDGEMLIVVDAGPYWYHQVDLPLNVQMSVTGEFSDGPPILDEPRDAELDLFSYTIEGDTTVVRSEGRPPWAGGPNGMGSDDVEDDAEDGSGPPSWVSDLIGQ